MSRSKRKKYRLVVEVLEDRTSPAHVGLSVLPPVEAAAAGIAMAAAHNADSQANHAPVFEAQTSSRSVCGFGK